jgi:hypothetical protein
MLGTRNQPRLEAVALACPAQRGEPPVTLGVEIGNDLKYKEHCLVPISDADPDTDSDSNPEDLSIFVAKPFYGSPERQSLSRSHGQRPWV